MKNKLAIIISLVLIIMTYICLLSGCKAESSDNIGNDRYFKIISKERYGSVMYDTRTGVEYWCSEAGYNHGNLTVLVDTDGKPLVYEGE